MSGGIPIQGLSVQVEALSNCDPDLIEVIVPVDSGTVEEALTLIRGDAPSDRSTLGQLSDEIDQLSLDAAQTARRIGRRYALLLG